jgi:diguanylate cyclase (GGDEF)-like protein/PAS domain S-box-containing protein
MHITRRKHLEVELRQASLVVERSPVVLFRWKAIEGWPVEMVSSNVKQFGYEAKELLSGEIPFSAIVHPDDLERITQEVTEYSASGVENFAHEYRIVSPAGEIFWLDDRTTIERDSGGNITHYQGVVIDITERKQIEVELRQANLVVERSPVVLFRWKAVEGWPVEMVSSNVKQFGYEAKELLSGEIPFSTIVHPDDLERITQEVTEYSASGVENFAHEYRIVSPAGEIFWLDDRTAIERDSGGNITHYQGVVIDITERKQIEEKLKYLATHDSLTRLINRSSMEEQLKNELLRADRYKHALSIFLLDLDHFKSINDTYGHQVGDAVLQKISRVIEGLIRKIDYAGRYGGEEFIIILPETSIGKAELLAERMCKQIAENSIQMENDDKLNITASIGIASFPEHGKSCGEIVSAADSAMYAAKDAGRNCVRTAKTTVRNHN